MFEHKTQLGLFIITRVYSQGKDQKWLSEQCGITPEYMSRILCGKTSGSRLLMFRIADIIQADPEELLGLWEEEKEKKSVKAPASISSRNIQPWALQQGEQPEANVSHTPQS